MPLCKNLSRVGFCKLFRLITTNSNNAWRPLFLFDTFQNNVAVVLQFAEIAVTSACENVFVDTAEVQIVLLSSTVHRNDDFRLRFNAYTPFSATN